MRCEVPGIALPRDEYLRDGGRYRFRRHSCFIHEPDANSLQLAPHRAHWQPTDYNALHGGMERWFEPIEARVVEVAAWKRLLCALGALFAGARPVERWYIEAHQFRIDTADGIGRPTPEGAHRDGVDYVAVILVESQQRPRRRDARFRRAWLGRRALHHDRALDRAAAGRCARDPRNDADPDRRRQSGARHARADVS